MESCLLASSPGEPSQFSEVSIDIQGQQEEEEQILHGGLLVEKLQR